MTRALFRLRHPLRWGNPFVRADYGWPLLGEGGLAPHRRFFLAVLLRGATMGDQGRWFKLWVTAPGDPHLGNFSLEDFARWCLFGIYMKVHGTNGIVTLQPPISALQRMFQVQAAEDVIAIIKRFPNCNVTPVTNSPVTLTVEWKNWQKYQGDYSSDRVARWRKKHGHSVTPKKRREEKRREVPPTLQPSELKREEKDEEPASRKDADEKFVAALRENPAYKGIDLDKELGRMDGWLSTPAGKGRQKTRRFIVNWLNRCDAQVAPSGPILTPKTQGNLAAGDEASRLVRERLEKPHET
jgi:hypothetical protein